MAGALLVAVDGNTQSLIPLFAIAVFIGFTLAQSGLVVHWWRMRPARWRQKAAVNAFGALVTGVSTIIFLVSKFTGGAWVVVIAVPSFIILFRRVEAYYRCTAEELGLGALPEMPTKEHTIVVVPVTSISRLVGHALSKAKSLSDDVVAVTVVNKPSEAARQTPPIGPADLERQWGRWDPGVPLVVLRTEYASAVEPIVEFIDTRLNEGTGIVVLIPVVLPTRLRYRILHNQMDHVLSRALRHRNDVVVARVCPWRWNIRPPRA